LFNRPADTTASGVAGHRAEKVPQVSGLGTGCAAVIQHDGGNFPFTHPPQRGRSLSRSQLMTTYKVVVDGSNIATEGRSLPSLSQLDEAVQCFIEEHPGAEVLVIVDTSFAHRIDPSEAEVFEAAYNAGEIITPPAGTIGRGDSFILKVADKLDATVFSNDSFQEFHGTYDWLFDRGRLIGGKPIPALGWVFTDRTPVRGPKSREAVREAKRTQVRVGSKDAMKPMPVPKAPPPFMQKNEADESEQGRGDRRRRGKDRKKGDTGVSNGAALKGAVAGAAKNTKQAKASAGSVAAGAAPRSDSPSDFVNESLPFVSFVSDHLPGTEVTGVVDSYASHGFYVVVGEARGYVPLRGAANPMPKSAREIVKRGAEYTFVVRAFDAERRGIELALPGSPAAGSVGDESPVPVRDHDRGQGRDQDRNRRGRRRRNGRGRNERSDRTETTVAETRSTSSAPSAKKVTSAKVASKVSTTAELPVDKGAAAKGSASKGTAKKAAAAKTAPLAKKAPATKKVAAKKDPVAKKAAVAKKAPAPKKAAAAKKTAAVKKAPTAKKIAAKKAPVVKKAAAVKKAPVATKATTAKKAPAAKKVAAKKTPAAQKAGAKKATAKTATAKK
jgi:hypothetical protein